jgi:high-affinity Fe2+/Pb2+ permease
MKKVTEEQVSKVLGRVVAVLIGIAVFLWLWMQLSLAMALIITGYLAFIAAVIWVIQYGPKHIAYIWNKYIGEDE